MRTIATGLAAMVLGAAPAVAQSGPSFDCAKASNPIERTICATPELAKADRDLAATYAVLSGRLTGPAKDHLAKDQVRWIGARTRACTGGATEIAACLKTRYERRNDNLKILTGGAYAFVSEQSIVKTGKVKSIGYAIDASYPQFDGPGVDFAATNHFFADGARSGAADAVPDASVAVDLEQTWSFEQFYKLHRPGGAALCVELSAYSFTGGAHGNGGTIGTLIDLRSGRIVPPAGVFAAGDEWLKTLTSLVVASLKKQFEERPGFDEALEPTSIAKLLREPAHYVYRPGVLEIVFNPYEVGPYAAGVYTVEIPYSRLKPLLRPDGPIAP